MSDPLDLTVLDEAITALAQKADNVRDKIGELYADLDNINSLLGRYVELRDALDVD